MHRGRQTPTQGRGAAHPRRQARRGPRSHGGYPQGSSPNPPTAAVGWRRRPLAGRRNAAPWRQHRPGSRHPKTRQVRGVRSRSTRHPAPASPPLPSRPGSLVCRSSGISPNVAPGERRPRDRPRNASGRAPQGRGWPWPACSTRSGPAERYMSNYALT